ncbi:MAG: sugar phosphate isomerase/epimerase family protein [Planctomycetota bacterium]|nr:sugar phosphate isomerase/epimerase family protein [Planctomycetota bacterium]
MTPITRRTLLTASAAAAATALTSRNAQARPTARALPKPTGQGRKGHQKALKIGMIQPGGTVEEKFAVAKECGFDGVEINSPSKLSNEQVAAASRATGIAVPGVVDSVHWQKPLSHPDKAVRQEGEQALRGAIRDAAAVGATSVLLVPAVVNKQVFYQDAWERSQAHIRAVLPMAGEHGIQILIENVWNGFLLGPTELRRYVDEFDSEWVGVHFDPGNLVRFGHPEQWVPILGDRIKKMDVKDFNRRQNSFNVKLTEGDTDWPAVMKQLDAIGYQGWFTAEMGGGDATYLRDLAQRMDSFLNP